MSLIVSNIDSIFQNDKEVRKKFVKSFLVRHIPKEHFEAAESDLEYKRYKLHAYKSGKFKKNKGGKRSLHKKLSANERRKLRPFDIPTEGQMYVCLQVFFDLLQL